MNERHTSPIKIIRARIRANRIADAAWRSAVFFVGFFLVGVGLILLVFSCHSFNSGFPLCSPLVV